MEYKEGNQARRDYAKVLIDLAIITAWGDLVLAWAKLCKYIALPE